MANLGFVEQKAKKIIDEMDRGRGNSPIFQYPINLEPPFKKFYHCQELGQKKFLQNLFNRPIQREEQIEYPRVFM